jgi:hypothetical protein
MDAENVIAKVAVALDTCIKNMIKLFFLFQRRSFVSVLPSFLPLFKWYFNGHAKDN